MDVHLAPVHNRGMSTKRKSGKLQDKLLERFCRAYVMNGHNGAAAARSVGKSSANAPVWASHQLSNPKVMERLFQLNEDILDGFVLSKEEAVAEMNKLAIFDPRHAFDEDGQLLHPKDMDDVTAANVKEVEMLDGVVTKVKFLDNKRSAIQDMMKYYNAFEDHQKSGVGEIHVHIDEKDAKA